jgi:serine/threonine-protein kinase
MRIRRHFATLSEGLPFQLRLPKLDPRKVRFWVLMVIAAAVAGYLVAYLIIFPTRILPGSRQVPRVLGLTEQEARDQLTRAELQAADSGSQPHPTAVEGSVVWQDPPPGLVAPKGSKVTLFTSAGQPKIAVPDIAGYSGELARRMLIVAGLNVAQIESVAAPTPRGVAMVTRPSAGTTVAPGSNVQLTVSRGAPTITVPSLLELSQADARTRLELDGLVLGTVTRRRTSEASPGTVVGQRPAAGTLAAPGTVVDIEVARSP